MQCFFFGALYTARNALQTHLGVTLFNQVELIRRHIDRKSTRLNSSHRCISYAVFCLKKNAQFQLYRIRFLYTHLLTLASYAIVVVFQPELRPALLHLVETRLFRAWTQELDGEIESLV